MSEVRLCQPQDIERLSKDHWREFHDHDPDFKMEWISKGFCIQAFDKEPIGYLFMYVIPNMYEKGKVGMIELYYLDPRYRKQGIGERMFKLAETVAKERGASKITASYNLKKPHRKFFERCGFMETHVGVAKEI